MKKIFFIAVLFSILIPCSSVFCQKIELIGERTRNFKKFHLGGENYRVVGSVAPIHYRLDPFDLTEEYKEIDLSLIQTSSKSWNWEMEKAGYQIRIWQELDGLKYAAQFQRAGKWITMAPFEMYYENDAGESQAVGRPVDASPSTRLQN